MQDANQTVRPEVEQLEDRCVPALIVSQTAFTPPLLDAGEVKQLLDRAEVATQSNDGIFAVVDRQGNILGVRVEPGVSSVITSNPDLLAFAIDGAVAKARTAAFFANNDAPLTSRTVGFISQSTVTEREVNSNPSLNPNIPGQGPESTLRGPGYVAPVKTGAHFPPDVDFTPFVDLFGIEHTNRDSYLAPGADGAKGTADDVPFPDPIMRFNATFIPGKSVPAPISYGEAILAPADLNNPAVDHYQARGIATLPGGIPLYEYGELVGGIGAFFPGDTGYATAENFSGSTTFNPALPDRTLEAEFIGVAAAGGSSGFGVPVGDLPGAPALPGFDIPAGRIDLVGVTLDIVGPGGDQGPANLVAYANANLGVGLGAISVGPASVKPVNSLGDPYIDGLAVPDGYLVAPKNGVNITAAEVQRIIEQGIAEANKVRAQIRLPNDERTRMVFAVADSTGEIVGLYRMADATVFSIDVAVAKARNTAYYDDPAQLQAQDQLPGVPAGASFTNRTFRFVSGPRFPSGIDGQIGPFNILNDPGLDPTTARLIGPPLPPSSYASIYGYDSFHAMTNFHQPQTGTFATRQNGIVFFPGSSAVYKDLGSGTTIVGGFGVSGDGVDQDDVVTHFGIQGFDPPDFLRADQFFFTGVRLPYQKFPRNPEN